MPDGASLDELSLEELDEPSSLSHEKSVKIKHMVKQKHNILLKNFLIITPLFDVVCAKS